MYIVGTYLFKKNKLIDLSCFQQYVLPAEWDQGQGDVCFNAGACRNDKWPSKWGADQHHQQPNPETLPQNSVGVTMQQFVVGRSISYNEAFLFVCTGSQ